MHTLWREIQGEQLDGNRPVAHRIMRPIHGSQSPSTNLMENTKWSKRVRWNGARSFSVQ